MKKYLLLSLFSFIFLIQCGSDGGSGVSVVNPTLTKVVLLKIDTVIYDKTGGLDNSLLADDYVKISVNSGSGVKYYGIKELSKGIEVPQERTITIKAEHASEDTKYKPVILWQGYDFENKSIASSPEIKVRVEDSDLSLKLIFANSDEEMATKNIFLTVIAAIENETIKGSGVKIDGMLFENGYYELTYVLGQRITLEGVLPKDNKNIVFNGFETSEGMLNDNPTEIDIHNDIVIEGKFFDRTFLKTKVKITGINSSDGDIYINDILVVADSDGNYAIEREPGIVLKFKAIPASSTIVFASWNDSVRGFLSASSTYEYTVPSKDVDISPVFVSALGSLVISIYPRTNYHGHGFNIVAFLVTNVDGSTNKDKSSTNYGGILRPLAWNNTVIQGVNAVGYVTLKAIPNIGFNPKDQTKVYWSGDITGINFEKSIEMSTVSKSASLSFAIEKRDMRIELKREYDTTGESDWESEPSSNNAKSYSILVETDKGRELIQASTFTSSIVKTFDWHTKVSVEVDPGKHYQAYSITHDNIKNPTDEGGLVAGIYEGKAKVTYDLEDNQSNASNTIILRHKTVDMSLKTKGGYFTKPHNQPEYQSRVNITGTGITAQDSVDYKATKYSVDGTSGDYSVESIIKVLSGIPIHLKATARTGHIFVKYNSSQFGSIITENTEILNTGEDFNIATYFKSPTYTLTLNMNALISTGNNKYVNEGQSNKVSKYHFKRDSEDVRYEANTNIKITNFIPLTIKAYPDGDHYSVLSVAGVKGNSTTLTLSNDHSTTVDFVHNQKDIKLKIYGGNDDRNKSHVKVSGTGLANYNTTYYASNRNVSLDGERVNVPVEYTFRALSGLKNRVEVAAITSSVHNFQKIEGEEIISLNPVGEHKTGINTYTLTNTSSMAEVSSINGSKVGVYFRINSYRGANNGLTTIGDEYLKFQGEEFEEPTATNVGGVTIYYVNTPGELAWLSEKIYNSYHNVSIRLKNDIYLGDNSDFKGFGLYIGEFFGSGNTIFDPNINQRGFIFKVQGANINGLSVVRGFINKDGGGVSGLVAESVGSILKYVTNAATIGAANQGYHVGGVVGHIYGGSDLSYLANYGTVYGDTYVGGVVGSIATTRGNEKFKYWYNKGEVQGVNYVGGVVGGIVDDWDSAIKANTHIYNVYNAGDVKVSTGIGGGIVGYLGWCTDLWPRLDSTFKEMQKYQYTRDFRFINSYNTGNITGNITGTRGGVGGLAGIIIGRRQAAMFSNDEDLWTIPFQNGYNIGIVKGSRTAKLVYEAGHRANFGDHMVRFDNVYAIESAAAGSSVWITRGLQYDKNHRYEADMGVDAPVRDGSPRVANVLLHSGGFSTNASKPGEANSYFGVSPSGKLLNTALQGLAESDIWVQTAEPNINGFTSRPTFRNMPEVDLPKFMFE